MSSLKMPDPSSASSKLQAASSPTPGRTRHLPVAGSERRLPLSRTEDRPIHAGCDGGQASSESSFSTMLDCLGRRRPMIGEGRESRQRRTGSSSDAVAQKRPPLTLGERRNGRLLTQLSGLELAGPTKQIEVNPRPCIGPGKQPLPAIQHSCPSVRGFARPERRATAAPCLPAHRRGSGRFSGPPANPNRGFPRPDAPAAS